MNAGSNLGDFAPGWRSAAPRARVDKLGKSRYSYECRACARVSTIPAGCHWDILTAFLAASQSWVWRGTVLPGRANAGMTHRPGPAIGQDNERVFRDILGMPHERYRQLVEDGVIY